MNATDENAGIDSVESLLPWYASGKLAPEELRRVEEALAMAPELRRRYGLILEERAAVVALNEALGAPSPGSGELLARLASSAAEAEETRNSGVLNWLTGWFSGWPPRALALSGMAAALIAVIEAGVLAALFLRSPQQSTVFETASVSRTGSGAGKECAFLLLAFTPEATAAQIQSFLETFGASFADGPTAGGIYRTRLCGKTLSADGLSAIVASMRKESGIVRFAAPAR